MRANGFRVTRAKPGGNAGKPAYRGRKILPLAASIAGATRAVRVQKNPCFIGFFAMARRLLILGVKVRAALMRHCRSSAMLLALGAASSAAGRPAIADHVEIVVAANHRLWPEPDQPVRSSRAAPRLREARRRLPAPSGCSQISPATMSALLAAQSQSSTATTTPAPTSRSDALKDLFSQIDSRRRRPDQQIGIRKRARRRRHQPRAGRRRVQQARQERRRLGQPRRNVVGAAGSGKGHHHHHHHVADSDGSGGTGASEHGPADRTPIRCCRR